MSETPDIDPPEAGVAEAVTVAAATAAVAACISCGTAIAGPYCAGCGQRNDDMRRSSFVLAKDFVKDTFAFDGRMWRTLGLLAAAPGTVPSNYSHGKRSRYTPPVRLFLVVSFLFFLTLGFTKTMFVAFEVTAKTPEQIAAAKAAFEKTIENLDDDAKEAVTAAREGLYVRDAARESDVVIDGDKLDCDVNLRTLFFVQPEDVKIDAEHWRRCRDSVFGEIRAEIETGNEGDATQREEAGKALNLVERAFSGVSRAIEDPAAFNSGINNWLPRVMFLMTPVLALIMALFLRGADALLFDHLVFSFYAHATAFAIIGVAIVAAQLGLPSVFTAANIALALYLVVAIKRGYRRSWIKAVWTGFGAGLLYVVALVSIVGGVMSNQLLQGA
jgi:hypothetical protein